MEPQVRYARTKDGVNIAYYTMGSGPPFVWSLAPTSHLLAERRVPEMREALDTTARFFRLVRYDTRGFGLSDRNVNLGLHAGDVIREENNVYGGAVNIAARISGLSARGEVLVSETVRSLARTSGGVSFEDRGRRRLKGVGEAVRVWVVREGE